MQHCAVKDNVNVSGRGSTWDAERTNSTERYEVQFQRDAQPHSATDDVDQAKYYARCLANWNLAAQVYDRRTQQIIFRARAYADRSPPRRDGGAESFKNSPRMSKRTTRSIDDLREEKRTFTTESARQFR